MQLYAFSVIKWYYTYNCIIIFVNLALGNCIITFANLALDKGYKV